jgi:endonuclease/exonuclease/phosphatase family metal-dependent hydrolase
MRIVSLNAWGGAMSEPLVTWVPQADADVLCVQEVTRTHGAGGWTQFTDPDRSLPQRADLFDDLRAALPDHRATFVPSDAGPVVTADGRMHRQEFGIAAFVAGTVDLVHDERRFVHGRFTDHERWPAGGRPRVAQAVHVLAHDDGRTVGVVHLHGLRDPAGKADTPARRAQATRLAGLARRVTERTDVTVVCGDLNVLPDSETFEILGAVGLVDLVGAGDTRSSAYTKPVRHADYLLVSDPGSVRSFEILERPEVSDHRPLVVDI